MRGLKTSTSDICANCRAAMCSCRGWDRRQNHATGSTVLASNNGSFCLSTRVIAQGLRQKSFPRESFSGYFSPMKKFALSVAVALLCCTAAAAPNILWLIAEDFGPHLGCYGTKEV